MPRTRLIGQLFPPFLFITVFAVLGTALYAVSVLSAYHHEQVERELEGQARLITGHLAEALATHDPARTDALAKELGHAVRTRVTVLDAKGVVWGDSEATPVVMDLHGDRPEVRDALNGRVGRASRYSYTTREQMAYVAVPIEHDGRIVGVARTSLPTGADARGMRSRYLALMGVAAAIALAAALLGMLAWRRLARQLDDIKHRAQRFARGELGSRVPVSETLELAGIAEAMNGMSVQLQERMETVLRQRNELGAVLASMVEGVLAFDADERVINLNRAAAELFRVSPPESVGRTIQEVIRIPELQRFITRTLAARETIEGDITLYHDGGERVLQAHGSVLRNGDGRHIGGLLVLNDVTRLRRLESARRDFVANVSHELRTPITSIKGYVETLLDGAIDDRDNADRFLRIILNQADRLNSLIGDLLTLSRIEDETEREELVVETARVQDVLNNALQACQAGASAKNVRLELLCDSGHTLRMNPALVEQAVVNLLDNAIKYSNPDTTVQVEALPQGDEFAVHVVDHGCGIAQEHLPRLFERFYRVDKARSRKLGGTGLGLAIVKHIVRMHGGRTDVQSTPGKGSTFSLYLPLS